MKAHQGEINYDVLQDMDVLHRNITEALRMHPPLILVLRYVFVENSVRIMVIVRKKCMPSSLDKMP